MSEYKGDKDGVLKDNELIRAFQSGDRGAFDILVERYKDFVFNLCCRFLGDKHEAEDTAQDIFVKVFCSIKKFGFRSSFYTWLYRISVNTCINRVRSLEYRRRKKNISLDCPDDPVDIHRKMEINDGGKTPETELEKKERIRLIQKAIDSLPVKQKVVIILSDIQGLSYDEIGRITGMKSGTIKSRLSRARLGLREKLRGIV
jgi:RNA polymerase sigma-70 factor (ECF subfamily)